MDDVASSLRGFNLFVSTDLGFPLRFKVCALPRMGRRDENDDGVCSRGARAIKWQNGMTGSGSGRCRYGTPKRLQSRVQEVEITSWACTLDGQAT